MARYKEIPNHKNFILRFKQKLNTLQTDNQGCLNWSFGKSMQGYGVINYNHKKYYAHRVSYFLSNKKINPNLVIDHICCNRGCVNAKHLQETTISKNIALEIERKGLPLCKNVSLLPKFLINGECNKGHKVKSYNDINVYLSKSKRTQYAKCRKCCGVKRIIKKAKSPNGSFDAKTYARNYYYRVTKPKNKMVK